MSTPKTFALAVAAMLLGLPPAALPGAPPEGRVVHVSPAGSDGAGDGSAARPFQTLARALEIALPEPEATVELAAGVYSLDSSKERFPLSAAVAGSLTIRGPASGEAKVLGTNAYALFDLRVPKGEGRPLLRFERLHLEGGLTGLMVAGEEGAKFEVELDSNRFTAQRYQGAEVVAGRGGSTRALVRRNRLDGAAIYGIDLATAPAAELEILVEENRIEDRSPPSPEAVSFPPRMGVALYLEPLARLTGAIDRNVFFNVPVGVLVTENGSEGDGGTVDLRISNSLIAGDPAGQNRLRHGFYLALWPHHHTSLRFLHNTVAHAQGSGVYQDEPVEFPERAEFTSISITGSIFWGSVEGDFSVESGGRDLPVYYREVRGNILGSSGRGKTEGNLDSDPLFPRGDPLAPAEDLYTPASGSPAVDALAVLDPSILLDARGACRVRDADGDGLFRVDLGALERPGDCLADERPFVRGDCDGNRSIEITDAVTTFDALFLGGRAPGCPDACDANDDGELNIADGIYSLGFLFLGAKAPPPPGPGPGADPTADRLGRCR